MNGTAYVIEMLGRALAAAEAEIARLNQELEARDAPPADEA